MRHKPWGERAELMAEHRRRTSRQNWQLEGSLAAAVVMSALAVPPAFAQLPPGATPGGARPALPADESLTPSDAPKRMFPIPPSVDRPLDVEEGERLFVSRFKLRGAVERPEKGIDLDELNSLIENLRQEQMQLNAVDKNGFTEPERVEIAEFITSVVHDPDLDMRYEDYEALIDKLRAIKAQREAGMTIGQMQEIAQAVTQYYRSAGFVLAQAFIPAQEVSEGEVTIQVQEGELGNVLVEGNERYSDELLIGPFNDLIDAPVEGQSIQSAILTVSDYPGLAVFGVFQPGQSVGTTDLQLQVQDEKPFEGLVRADNHGTRFTGERRLFGEVSWNNPTGDGDRLTAVYLRQFDPANAFFGEVEYERMLKPGLTLGINASRNPFDIGAEIKDLGLSGQTDVLEVFSRASMWRSLDENVSTKVTFRRSQSITEQDGLDVARDDLAMLVGQIDYDSLDREGRAFNFLTLGAAVGLGDNFGGRGEGSAEDADPPPSRVGGSGEVASNDFLKIFMNYSRLEKVTDTHSVLVRLEGQWAPELLASTEQYSIGGPANVRAYNVSELLADRAVFASFEYSLPLPLFEDTEFYGERKAGDVFRLLLFMDYAWGGINDPTDLQESSVHVAGAGTGVSFDIPGMFTGRLQWAYPLTSRIPGAPGDPDEGKWWIDFTYQF